MSVGIFEVEPCDQLAVQRICILNVYHYFATSRTVFIIPLGSLTAVLAIAVLGSLTAVYFCRSVVRRIGVYEGWIHQKLGRCFQLKILHLEYHLQKR